MNKKQNTEKTGSIRYFFVAYSYKDYHNSGVGNMKVVSETYPKISELTKTAAKSVNGNEENVVIINIFEFRTRKDYESFWDE
ncbi:hypothetical protein [Acinetobacter sp.]|uniref:hypothetical protein n=1 Tax=Acinetobacter sp. TaxID=472 RepID=UPI003CFD6730